MSQSFGRINSIVMPVNAGTGTSAAINIREVAEDAKSIAFGSPSGLDANTYTILVSQDNGVTYTTLQMVKSDTGTLMDYPFPAAGKTMVIPMSILACYDHLKINSSGAIVTTAKSIQLTKCWEGMG